MADEWARPDERPIGRSTEIIDVPLTGPDDDPHARPDTGAPPTDWRRLLAIALVGGTVLGVGGSVLLLSADDDEPVPTDTTLSADDIAAAITTPPTLAPRETLPAPDFAGDEVATSADVTVPAYPEVPGVGLADLVQFDIGGAVGLLGDDVPRRSETHVELGVGGYVLDVTIERDPVRDRYQVIFESRGNTQVAIVDVPSGITYVNPGHRQPRRRAERGDHRRVDGCRRQRVLRPPPARAAATRHVRSTRHTRSRARDGRRRRHRP